METKEYFNISICLKSLIRAGQRSKSESSIYIIQKGKEVMLNTYQFIRTIIDWETMEKNFGGVFAYVSEEEYHDKKGKLSDGVTVTLRILRDDGDYGINPKTGKKRRTNLGQNFNVTILNGKTETSFQYDDKVKLIDFDQEHSYAIDFDLLLRFKDIQKVQPTSTQPTSSQPHTPLSKVV